MGAAVHTCCRQFDAVVDGQIVEMATFGREGMVGLAFGGIPPASFGCYLIRVLGAALRIEAGRMHEVVSARPGIQHMTLTYTEVLMALNLQSMACNAFHSVEARCCRWIIASGDRTGREDVPLTHEYLAEMLGVQRSTVSAVTMPLQDTGLIHQRRGKITILDRTRLENAACECYGILRAQCLQLLPLAQVEPEK
ncbi:helix-turn-helix domain-containing protein [Microvirga tunisiensis]|uniref:Crp/Fnr family transcriptional regulator n=1 Tax=Microvirga tunisiensis TaxID=2108360 RepID=A0A5N7MPM2_9HYPH|nr:Crp/Fnr family transcriptional regulator [Microvirga tunisiensis]MPR28590.1 Crp/Fnr family transcriptional regulator [Microvirga tunisiensis]